MKEKKRKSKIFEIVTLIIAILVLLFCFWAYSKAREVKIKDKANVKPNKDDINIIFSPVENLNSSEVDVDKIEGISNTGESVGKAEVVETEDGTIANLQVKFTKPGQEVVYTFYSHNKGKYDAYLDTITYSNVAGGNFFKRCSAVNTNTTNRYLVSKACEDISMTVKAGDNVITDGSITGIKDHKLEVGDSEKVIVTIKYDKNGTLVDGDFMVEFGSVSLTYLTKFEMESK